MSTKKRLHDAIGKVVYASQMFEFVFTITVRLAIKQRDVHHKKDFQPIIEATGFKTAVANWLKDPLVKAALSEEQAKRIAQWVEYRHLIIHRWFLEEGWPTDKEAQKIEAFINKCRTTEYEAYALSAELCDLLIPWKEKFPEFQDTADHLKIIRTDLRKLTNVLGPMATMTIQPRKTRDQ